MNRLILIMGIALSLSFSSCKSKVSVIRETDTVHDTTYISKVSRDSVYLHDSVYVETFVRGDTVYHTKYKVRNRIKEKIITDTLYHEVHDTIVTSPIVKRLSESDLTFARFGKVAAVIFALLILIFFTLAKRK